MISSPVVAIVDSGMSTDFYNSHKDKIIGGTGFQIQKKEEGYFLVQTSNFEDECGHGTLCSDLILKYCPQARIFMVKILDKRGESSSVILKHALEYLGKRDDINIISMSLSVSPDKYGVLEEVCRKISEKGIFLTAAVRNGIEDFNKSVPACYPSVFGVKGLELYGEESFYYDDAFRKNVICNNIPVQLTCHDGSKQFFTWNSKSNALFASVLANALTECELKDINSYLEEKSAEYLERYRKII